MSRLEISAEFLDALQQLSSVLEADDALDQTLDTVVNLSVATLQGCDAAGITLRMAGEDMTFAASDEYTMEIDKIQSDLGGPCVSALEDGKFYRIEAVSQESRWPEFCHRAAEKGFRASLSFPLNSDGWAGALNLYATTENAFTEEGIAAAEVFARQATIALRNAQTYAAARAVADQLNEALQTRDMIGQAKGILMEREGISDQEAFEMLRTISQNSNVKLRDIAHRLIEDKAPRD